jgi:hypothetical protein
MNVSIWMSLGDKVKMKKVVEMKVIILIKIFYENHSYFLKRQEQS